MSITTIRLHALLPESRPQVIDINLRPGQERVLGRNDFSTGEDTVISRRHALFTLTAGPGGDVLGVQNLSLINGVLVNFVPVPPYGRQRLQDGDEIVSSHFQIFFVCC
jgi:pSer/pThr/pTyr-binding forkhead associated (FHA) protein